MKVMVKFMEQMTKKKIVFIVYRAGWWGCFDSIYRKALENNDSECYVIPVPYYERSTDGNGIDYGKKHYEGDKLPKDIAVTDYNGFSFQIIQPDIIYMHNPYDGLNKLDAVDTQYYSEELKKSTKMLIYIPHMLYIDSVPDYLQYSTVYQNVDKIILANEDVKLQFHDIPKEKLEVSGSPLVEYIEKLQENRPEIPASWLSMLDNNKDFGGKRAILYNLGFSELSYGTDALIKKLEYVFDYMKTRKDVVFIWRPEKEIGGKLDELPENIMNEYLRLTQRFIEERIGVYDITDDVCVAAVICDAFMGEDHPNKNLFGIQGKPVLLLDKECRCIQTDDELRSVSFLDCTPDGENIWFVANEYNLLCKMNLISGEIEIIDEIPYEVVYGGINYCGIIKKNNQIYLNPYHAEAFVTYNIDQSEFIKTYLPEKQDVNFDYIVPYKEYLFLKSKAYPAIIRYNTITEEYKYYNSWVDELETYVNEEDMNEPYFLWGVVACKEKLMLASSKANVLMEFNMENGDHKFYEVGPKGSKFFGMEYDGENFWTIPYLGKDIMCWNYNTGDWKTYNDFSDEIEDKSIPFRAILKNKQSLMIFPCQADFGLIIDLKEKLIKKNKIDLPYPENTYKSEFYKKAYSLYSFAKVFKEGVFITETMYDESILLLDLENDKIEKLPCRISLKSVNNYFDKLVSNYRDNAKYPCSISETVTLRVVIDGF